MKCISSLHCSIYGSMDCTNLRLLGFTTAPDSGDPADLESLSGDMKGAPSATKSDVPPRQYAVLDYFPGEGTSFFFTFVIQGPDLKDISMDHHEPIHLDTLSPQCTAVLPGNLCVSGTKEGTLVLWREVEADAFSVTPSDVQRPISWSFVKPSAPSSQMPRAVTSTPVHSVNAHPPVASTVGENDVPPAKSKARESGELPPSPVEYSSNEVKSISR